MPTPSTSQRFLTSNIFACSDFTFDNVQQIVMLCDYIFSKSVDISPNTPPHVEIVDLSHFQAKGSHPSRFECDVRAFSSTTHNIQIVNVTWKVTKNGVSNTRTDHYLFHPYCSSSSSDMTCLSEGGKIPAHISIIKYSGTIYT